jgi:hypothetical protein
MGGFLASRKMAETAKDKAGLSVGESTGSSAANEPLGRTGAMSASTCHKNGAIGGEHHNERSNTA